MCLTICSLAPNSASAEGEITKVLTTISKEPVTMDGVYSITAATSTEGCTLSSYGWFENGAEVDGTFGTGTYTVQIMVTPLDGYYFSDSLSVYLNNSAVSYSWSGNSIILYRDYTAVQWAPSITKNPTDENVNEGEMASFVAIATYTTDYEWTITSADGKTTYKCNDLPNYFSGVTIGGDGKEKMNIRNVPAELNGWKVKCTFSGPGGSATSASATIKVKTTATPSPSPTATPTPSPSPSPTATPQPEESSKPEATAAPVETSSPWYNDDDSHWHEDSTGAKTDKASHDLTWSVVTQATKKSDGVELGVCNECGYSVNRVLEYEDDGDDGASFMRYVVGAIIIFIVVVLVGLVVSAVSESRQRKRRKAAHSHHSSHYNGRH